MSTITALDRPVRVTGSRESFIARMFRTYMDNRQARARAYVNQHLASMSDHRLKSLGLSQDEINYVRTHKAVPVSYWS